MLLNCDVGEDSWRVPWAARRSNQSIPKEINPEYSLEGLILKMKLQYFWPPDVKTWLTRKDLNAGKDWRQEKGTTEDKMVRWPHRLNGHEFAQAPGDGKGRQGSLACCSPWGLKESDTTEQLNWRPLVFSNLTQLIAKLTVIECALLLDSCDFLLKRQAAIADGFELP